MSSSSTCFVPVAGIAMQIVVETTSIATRTIVATTAAAQIAGHTFGGRLSSDS